MADLTSSQPDAQTSAEYEAVLTQIFAEIRSLNEQMQQDRREIDRLKANTVRLEAETQAILSRLKAMV